MGDPNVSGTLGMPTSSTMPVATPPGNNPGLDYRIDSRGDTLWDDYIGGRQRDQDTYADIGRYGRNFADTGGFTPGDINNIRARAVAPIRSIYSSANREVDRAKRLSGGMANFAASKAKMAREGSYALSDATTNAEASIADMTQRGKLAGIGALTSAYGTTPGQSSMYGNLGLQYGNQALNRQKMTNDYDMQMKNYELLKKQAPNKFDRFLGRVKGITDIGKDIGTIWAGF
jgi:hypothetical protein